MYWLDGVLTPSMGANSKNATPPKIFKPPILGVVLKWIFPAFYTSYAVIPSARMHENM